MELTNTHLIEMFTKLVIFRKIKLEALGHVYRPSLHCVWDPTSKCILDILYLCIFRMLISFNSLGVVDVHKFVTLDKGEEGGSYLYLQS